jgi:glycosyltransferase involved in cell wall biosynthesis
MSSVMDGPLVTIAIPTFQRPEMLRQAIDSAVAQTYRNIEVLVSDSAGDPEIAALVEGYGDPRLRYRDNGRVTDSVTNAKAMYMDATGELVATLHDDDIWEPFFLELLVPPLMADPQVVVSFGDHSVIDAEGSLRPDIAATYRFREGLRAGIHQPFFDLATSKRAIPIVVSAVFRASAIDWSEWRDEAGITYDLWLAYLLARGGGAAWYEPTRVSRYRHHPTAVSSTARIDEASVWCFDRFLADDRLKAVRPGLRRAAASHHTGLALVELRQHGPDARARARHELLVALRGGPTARTLVACALWPMPLPVRQRVIGTAGRVRSRRRGRETEPSPA